jgi:hypothetical protein
MQSKMFEGGAVRAARARQWALVVALTSVTGLLASHGAWADDLPPLPARGYHGWDVNWELIWQYMKKDVYLKKVGLAFLLCFTVGVQMAFFPAYHWIMRFQAASAMRLAYFAATVIFLAIFTWIYWDLMLLVYATYWMYIIALIVACALIYWLLVLPKKVMS